MTDGQSHIVGTWTLNHCFSMWPVSFSLQVSLSSFIHRSVILSSPSFFSQLIQPPVFSWPFHFLSPYLSLFHLFISLHHGSMTSFYLPYSGISISIWCSLFPLFHLHSLFHGSIICFLSTYTDISFISCPLLTVFFEIHWCFLPFMVIPLFHSSFSSLTHARIRGTCSGNRAM